MVEIDWDVWNNYLSKLTPAKRLHPEITNFLGVFDEVKSLISIDIIKKYAIVPTFYKDGILRIVCFSSDYNKINKIISYLKNEFGIKNVEASFPDANDINFKKAILNTLKNYWDLDFSEEELRELEE